jgi:hypothetical protein
MASHFSKRFREQFQIPVVNCICAAQGPDVRVLLDQRYREVSELCFNLAGSKRAL